MNLEGRAAVVTGGGSGIGAATARVLCEAGAAVLVAARNEREVVRVAAELREDGFQAFAFRCDVTDPRQVRDMALSGREAMDRLDILVNSAGTATSNPLAKITLGEWNHILAVNATGTFLCTQAVFPGMVEQRWGRIVNVASIAGLQGDRYIAAYTAAKHAVVGFTKAVAAEAEGTGVTVNAVCPGYVDTPLTEETIERIMRHTGNTREWALRAILEQSGQARLIGADEVALAIRELCEDESGERNGQIVVLDGPRVIA